MSKPLELTGKTFGRLTVISRAFSKNGDFYWNCLCSCGNTTVVRGMGLTGGNTKSCGCLKINKKTGDEKEKWGIQRKSEVSEKAAFNRVLRTYKRRAALKNLEFSLTENRFRELTKGNCYYCGEEPFQGVDSYKYNGIDRVDSSKGYIEGNVVSCCMKCNVAKSDQTKFDFLNWIKRVYEYCKQFE